VSRMNHTPKAIINEEAHEGRGIANRNEEVYPMLNSLRVLDLTDEKGFLCGKILAELGADVIKVERPGGDPSRMIGPFFHDEVDPEKSLYWFAYNSSKRGITLNIEAEKGRELFKRLVYAADVVIESFPPDYLEGLGLGYRELSSLNPRIIITSITPFGHTGPRKDYKASDISLMALSGIMSVTGDSDRSPLRFGLDQSYCLAGTHAVIGILIALHHHRISGEGQHIDVSAFDSLCLANFWETIKWEYEKRIVNRSGDRMGRGMGTTRQVWKCKDGYLTWVILGGKEEMKIFITMIEIMDKEGMAGNLKSVEWEKVHISRIPDDEMSRYEEVIAAFFMKHTKNELEQLSLKYNLRLSIINDIVDNAEGETLAFREYWTDVDYPELSTAIKSPGHLFLSNEVKTQVRFRAPRIGEHNNEIFEKELGLSRQEMSDLKRIGIL